MSCVHFSYGILHFAHEMLVDNSKLIEIIWITILKKLYFHL